MRKMYRVAIDYPPVGGRKKEYIAWYFSFANSKEHAIKQVKEHFMETLTFRTAGGDITEFRFTAYDCNNVEFSHMSD